MLRTNLQADTAEELWSQVHAVDRGRSILSGTEERAFDSAVVPSTGAARQGARDGGVPGLCPVGHPETSAEAPARDRAAAIGERSQ